MMARLRWYLDPLSPNQLKKNVKKKKSKKVGPPLKKLSGSVHVSCLPASHLGLHCLSMSNYRSDLPFIINNSYSS